MPHPAIVRLRRMAGTTRRDDLFVPCGDYGNRPTSNILILQQGTNPTTDYYLRPRLPPPDSIPTTFANLATNPDAVFLPHGAFVVIVRYINSAWAQSLRSRVDRLSGVAYLMDDDLPVARHAKDLPLRYRWKIQTMFMSQRASLSVICDRIWVSTDHLASKYRHNGVSLLPPVPLSPPGKEIAPITYFYHGSASHAREQEWLVDIVRAVQSEIDNLTFVTVGGTRVRKLYAGIPRLLVLHPMAWPTYVQAVPAIRHDIGLAPLMPGPFNRSRSHTRFFDITRLGAAGIYSAVPPFAQFVRAGVDGLLVANDPATWARTIIQLAQSHQLRADILSAARERTHQLTMDVACPWPIGRPL